MYRFQLKVYDAAGQSSTAQVDVFVRRPATSEPRGWHILLILSFKGNVFLLTSFLLGSRRGKEYRHYSSIELGSLGWIKIKGR